MDSRSLYLGAVLLALILAFSVEITEAKAFQSYQSQIEDSSNSDNGRVRRDIQGVFDMIAGFFKSDPNGNSPAKGMISGFMNAIGSLGKPGQAGAAK